MSDAVAAGRRSILHVDMDAFYVAVETLLNPSLRGKPVIVGGDGARGVVASCNYEARAFGVHSAMPSVRAKRLCPHAIFLHGNHGLYGTYSERIHAVFNSFTPVIEPIALDEAFLDVTNARRLFGSGAETALAVRERVLTDTGLVCSVGVASSKLLAKLASKSAKPPIGDHVVRVPAGAWVPGAGVLEVIPGQELAFLHPQPVRALWGVGPKTFERLARFGVSTIGDLAALPASTLVRALGEASGRHLHALAHGIDDRPVEADRALKSVGHEETFAIDHHDPATLEVELLRMADAVASRLRANSVRGRTVQLKVKTSEFRLITRSRTLPQPIDTARPLYATARELLHADDVVGIIGSAGCRLLGVSMSNLVPAPVRDGAPDVATAADRRQTDPAFDDGDGDEGRRGMTARVEGSDLVGESAPVPTQQLGLFDAPAPVDALAAASGTRGAPDDRGALDARAVGSANPSAGDESANDQVIAATVDAIRARFGAKAVGPAALAGRKGLRVKVAGDTQWGPAHDGEDAGPPA
jgi:DNA polymerase IV